MSAALSVFKLSVLTMSIHQLQIEVALSSFEMTGLPYQWTRVTNHSLAIARQSSARQCYPYWIGLSRVYRLHQHSIGYPGDSFTGQKTQPAASKYWRKSWRLASHRPEEAPIPPGASHRVTSELLKKEKPYWQWVQPSETKPHTAGWPVQVLYRTIDCATIDATQHFSRVGG